MKEYGDELFIYAMALQKESDIEQEVEEQEDEEQVEELFDKITKDIEALLI